MSTYQILVLVYLLSGIAYNFLLPVHIKMNTFFAPQDNKGSVVAYFIGVVPGVNTIMTIVFTLALISYRIYGRD